MGACRSAGTDGLDSEIQDQRATHRPSAAARRSRNCQASEDGQASLFFYRKRGDLLNKRDAIVEAAGIKRMTAHSARHGFATTALRKMDPKTAAWLGGWKNVRLFMETYAHAIQDITLNEAVFDTDLTQPTSANSRNNENGQFLNWVIPLPEAVVVSNRHNMREPRPTAMSGTKFPRSSSIGDLVLLTGVNWLPCRTVVAERSILGHGAKGVVKPTRRGFGTRMIASIFGNVAGWSVNLDFDPAGRLRCSMQFHPQDEDRTAAKFVAAAG
jgi:hypothetical protein